MQRMTTVSQTATDTLMVSSSTDDVDEVMSESNTHIMDIVFNEDKNVDKLDSSQLGDSHPCNLMSLENLTTASIDQGHESVDEIIDSAFASLFPSSDCSGAPHELERSSSTEGSTSSAATTTTTTSTTIMSTVEPSWPWSSSSSSSSSWPLTVPRNTASPSLMQGDCKMAYSTAASRSPHSLNILWVHLHTMGSVWQVGWRSRERAHRCLLTRSRARSRLIECHRCQLPMRSHALLVDHLYKSSCGSLLNVASMGPQPFRQAFNRKRARVHQDARGQQQSLITLNRAPSTNKYAMGGKLRAPQSSSSSSTSCYPCMGNQSGLTPPFGAPITPYPLLMRPVVLPCPMAPRLWPPSTSWSYVGPWPCPSPYTALYPSEHSYWPGTSCWVQPTCQYGEGLQRHQRRGYPQQQVDLAPRWQQPRDGSTESHWPRDRSRTRRMWGPITKASSSISVTSSSSLSFSTPLSSSSMSTSTRAASRRPVLRFSDDFSKVFYELPEDTLEHNKGGITPISSASSTLQSSSMGAGVSVPMRPSSDDDVIRAAAEFVARGGDDDDHFNNTNEDTNKPTCDSTTKDDDDDNDIEDNQQVNAMTTKDETNHLALASVMDDLMGNDGLESIEVTVPALIAPTTPDLGNELSNNSNENNNANQKCVFYKGNSDNQVDVIVDSYDIFELKECSRDPLLTSSACFVETTSVPSVQNRGCSLVSDNNGDGGNHVGSLNQGEPVSGLDALNLQSALSETQHTSYSNE